MDELPAPPGPPAPELRIVESRVYRGPNVWSYDPAVHLLVDLGILEHYPTSRLPGFTEALLDVLPGIGRHTCSRGHAGGFVERMTEGTWLGHVCEHVALQLQQEAGHDMRRGKTRMVRGSEGRYNVIYGYTDETVGLSAGQLAARLVNDLVSAVDYLRDNPHRLDDCMRELQMHDVPKALFALWSMMLPMAVIENCSPIGTPMSNSPFM